MTTPFRHQNNEATPSVPRVGGSGFTVFHWQGQAITWAQTIGHQSPQPVAPPEVIQPMDQRYPQAIITPAAIGPGTLQLALYEKYNEKVWDAIMGRLDAIDGQGANVTGDVYNDLAEVFMRVANVDPANGIECVKMVYPATNAMGSGVGGGAYTGRDNGYADVYRGCVITDIRDDEQIDIGTMSVTKSITIQYRYGFRVHDQRSHSELYSTSF